MSTHHNDEFLYRRKLSQPMAELLTDPFSELTRKCHNGLLITATITLLLSAGLISVTDVGVASAKFILSTPQLAKWLALAVTSYLLIVYVLRVRVDWTIAKAKHWSPLASIEDTKAEMQADQDARVRASKERSDRLDRLQTEQRRIEAEMRPRLNAISARWREIETILSKLTESASLSPEEHVQRTSLARESSELARMELATLKELTECLAPVEKAIRELMQTISLEPTILMWREHSDIEPTIRTFSNLTRLRLMTEILFPVVYAVFALVWTVSH